MLNEIAFVAIAVSDIQRSRSFYEGVLGLRPDGQVASDQWSEYTLGAMTIAIGCHPAFQPSRDGTSVAFEVDDIDTTIGELKNRGVTFEMDKIETPVCWMAMFRDPDGNRLMVHKRKT